MLAHELRLARSIASPSSAAMRCPLNGPVTRCDHQHRAAGASGTEDQRLRDLATSMPSASAACCAVRAQHSVQ